jgi:hypothetical protein
MKVTVWLVDEHGPATISADFDHDQAVPFSLAEKVDDKAAVSLSWEQMRQLVAMMIPIFKLHGYDDFC